MRVCRYVALIASVPWAGAAAADESGIKFFERHVRPILVARCHQCHGPEKQESDLRLDSAAAALKGGVYGAAVVPGRPGESMLVYATSYQNEDLQMPPKGPLPNEEITILRRWVDMGAPWPEESGAAAVKPFDLAERKASHWAWQPVHRPTAPQVKDTSWPRGSIDHFVLARLEERGLKPAPDADRQTLIRRAYLDLTGLPPTPGQVAAFLADQSPDAFQRVIDRLLASPRFGERWARRWFDLVRYAETYGHEGDYTIPHAWQYRDYVIRAFNADVPYNQFVMEHIAGDLMHPPRRHPSEGYNESMIATGFWFMYEQTHAPTDVRQHEADRVENQIDVMTKAFLGMTVGCARCHDHKFDAISTRDYYALAGFLKSSREQIALLDPHGKIVKQFTQLAQLREEGTTLLRETLPEPNHESGRDFSRRLMAASDDVEASNINHPLYVWTKLKDRAADMPAAAHELAQEIRRASAVRDDATDHHWLMRRDHPPRISDWFLSGWAFDARRHASLVWDASQEGLVLARPGMLDSGSLAANLQGAARSPTFIIPAGQLHLRAKGRNAQIRVIVDNFTMNDQHSLLFDGLIAKVDSGDEFKWITIKGDLGKYIGERAYLSLEDSGEGWLAVDEIVFGDGPPPADPPSTLLLAALESGELDSNQSLADAYGRVWVEALRRLHTGELDAAHIDLLNWVLTTGLLEGSSVDARLVDLRSEILMADESLPAPMKVLAMTDGSGQDERVYLRGKHQNLGDVVPRRFLEALSGPENLDCGPGSGRLELARRIADPANPLFARAVVNRIWYYLFGRGIAATVDNLGLQGERPTHPELLDWLADEFVASGWSQKKLIRQLMLSRAYQMSSRPLDTISEEHDPANLLWHRAAVWRLEGEVIRDSLLAVSGRLDCTMYGPSVPAYLSPFAESRFQPKSSGPLDGNGRRSVYLEVRRNYLPPMFVAFDTPTPFTSVGRRNISYVPAQALTMLNDPLVASLTRHWAERILKESPSASRGKRVEQMYESALSRRPSDAELNAAERFIDGHGELLAVPLSERDNDVAIWSELAHVLFNHKEFLLRN